jgi:AraC-like DNA-binding protein
MSMIGVTQLSLALVSAAAYYVNSTVVPMIRGIKDMIAGCLKRIRARTCATCEHRDACAFVRLQMPGAKRPERRGGALASLFGEIAKAIGKEIRSAKSPLRREVERHLEPLLALGAARIDRVAKAMGCSRQTLYRRLKAEDLTFEQILDDLRHRRALKLVRNLPVKEAAYRLGFSDPAAFSRAFKRWTGQSPSLSRAQAG